MRLIPATVVAASCLLAASVRADNYTYTLIDQLDKTFTASWYLPSLNDSGVVAYTKPLTTNGSERALFVSTSATPLFTDSGSPYDIAPANLTCINNNGVVAMRVALDAGGFGIITAAQGSPANLVYQTSPGGFSDFGDPWINNNGIIAFNGMGTSSAFYGIYKGTGATYTTVMNETTALLVPGPQRPSINDAGTVAFTAFMSDTLYTLFTQADGGVAVPLTDSTGSFKYLYTPVINNSGSVAFRAEYDTFTGTQVHTMQAGSSTLNTVMDVAGPFSSAPFVTLNDNGRVVFTGVLDGSSAYGVYDGSDPAANKILAPGDPLFGKIVATTGAQGAALNANGQVAMLVVFTDDSRAIVLATPVPEPASALLLVPGLLLLRRRRR
jgi:hypothetical protein